MFSKVIRARDSSGKPPSAALGMNPSVGKPRGLVADSPVAVAPRAAMPPKIKRLLNLY